MQGFVYTDRDVEPELIPMVFMPLLFMTKEQREPLKRMHLIYADVERDQIFPRSVNGLPMFGAFHTLNEADANAFAAFASEAKKMLDQFKYRRQLKP